MAAYDHAFVAVPAMQLSREDAISKLAAQKSKFATEVYHNPVATAAVQISNATMTSHATSALARLDSSSEKGDSTLLLGSSSPMPMRSIPAKIFFKHSKAFNERCETTSESAVLSEKEDFEKDPVSGQRMKEGHEVRPKFPLRSATFAG